MSNLTLQQALNLAGQHLEAGRLAEAEALYRQILQHDPRHADAAHCLGYISHLRGDRETALRLVLQAIELAPSVAAYQQNLGDLLLTMGRLDDAESALRRAIQLDPRSAASVMKLGLVHEHRNQLEAAAKLYRDAIALEPHMAEAHCNLGDAMYKMKRHEDAVAAYDRAIACNPQLAAAYANRAAVMERMHRYDKALADVQRGIQLKGDMPQALCTLGRLMERLGRHADAMACFGRALALNPQLPEAHVGLSIIHLHEQSLEAAMADCRRALEIDPNFHDAHVNLGIALFDLGRDDEALAECEAALQCDPTSSAAVANRALILLRRGDLARGFEDYDRRFDAIDTSTQRPEYNHNRWRGEDLSGKTILLWYEQGLGDTIQFVRYAKPLAERGATVILEAQDSLHRLLNGVAGVNRIIRRDDPMPQNVDFNAPLMSLPRVLGTTLETIPADVPYLHADPALAAAWGERLPPRQRLRVGIAWQGNPTHRLDRRRSMNPLDFAPLATIDGVQLFSLQIGQAAGPRDQPAPEMIDLTPQITDFADTAALLTHLDVVVTIDSAVSHLAGAMARPTWILLIHNPDFRWLHSRSDTPWYPTARLFRQQSMGGGWGEVMQRVKAELESQPQTASS